MNENTISLKSIFDLRVDPSDEPIRYRIPAYQRGFRWTSREVLQLLEDVRDFTCRENAAPDEFYCLQPLVLRPQDGGAFEVVDGQQRLTTLLLVLRHFNSRLTERYRLKLFTLEYETRPDLHSFLENPSPAQSASNVDFFHIAEATAAIEQWFAQRESEVETIKGAFLNKVKVIWYELSADENPVEAFTRLNVGKIPLTNDELIRALFLRRAGSNKALAMKIAYEWDLLEKGLQRDDFWCFLSNDIERRGNRIGYLFDLVARGEGMASNDDSYATFYHFGRKLSGKGADAEKAWLALKQVFMLLEEWFDNPRLYHLIGFMVCQGVDINDIREMANECPKDEFREKLRGKIFSLLCGSNDLEELDEETVGERVADLVAQLGYGSSAARHQIRAVLLLFNVATLLLHPASTVRFQFKSYKMASWDIEHVRSIASKGPETWKGQREWLQGCLGYLQSGGEEAALQERITQFLALKSANDASAQFEPLYDALLKHFGEADGGEPDHSLANLVLLDQRPNRSYKNAPFAVKRHKLLSLDREGIFVPLCTRNVFLKCYSQRVNHALFWTEDDREGYLQAVVVTLRTFFQGDWIHA